MNKPKVSIIIPVFNVEKFIARAIKSCINQSLTDIEIIIVDDKSNDKSMDIARTLAMRDNRIKIVYNAYNSGTFVSRNNGFLHANADYIMFLDADDFLDPGACELLYEKSYEINETEVILFDAYIYKHENHKCLWFGLNDAVLDQYGLLKLLAAQKYISWNIHCKLIKTELYIKVLAILDNREKIIMAEDSLVSFVLFSLANSFTVLKAPLYYYCQNEDSISAAKNNSDIQKLEQINNDYELVIKNITALSLMPGFNNPLARLFLQILKRAGDRANFNLLLAKNALTTGIRIKEKYSKLCFSLKKRCRPVFIFR